MTKIYFKKIRAVFAALLLLPFFSLAQINLLQTTNNAVVANTVPSCVANPATYANSYARLYNLTALGYSSFAVTKISFAVQGFGLGTATNFPVSVEVYSSTGGAVTNNLTKIGEETVNITAAMIGTIVEVPLATPALVSSPEMLIVVSAPTGVPTDTFFYLGGNSNGQTAAGYIKASNCGVNDYTSFAAIGSQNAHIVLFPTGNATTLCPTGDITLSTQAEVDQFKIDYPNCTQITGNLIVAANSGTTNITDLTPLENLTSVSGLMVIDNNQNLTSLNGLNNLTTVGGLLIIANNATLTNINGLSSLTSIGSHITIESNASLAIV